MLRVVDRSYFVIPYVFVDERRRQSPEAAVVLAEDRQDAIDYFGRTVRSHDQRIWGDRGGAPPEPLPGRRSIWYVQLPPRRRDVSLVVTVAVDERQVYGFESEEEASAAAWEWSHSSPTLQDEA